MNEFFSRVYRRPLKHRREEEKRQEWGWRGGIRSIESLYSRDDNGEKEEREREEEKKRRRKESERDVSPVCGGPDGPGVHWVPKTFRGRATAEQSLQMGVYWRDEGLDTGERLVYAI